MYTRAKLAAPLAAAALLGAAPLGAQQRPVAPGWYALTAVPTEYQVGVEPLRRPGGDGFVGATVRGFVDVPRASAILQQSIRADGYRGRRVRVTGWLRTAGDTTAVQAALWMRVDGANGPLSSDYMIDRPIVGTRDWAPYAVVLDVPHDALGVSFGAALTGRGQLWLDDVALETVGREVATTGRPGSAIYGGGIAGRVSRAELVELRRANLAAYRRAPDRPLNLSFEQTPVVAAR